MFMIHWLQFEMVDANGRLVLPHPFNGLFPRTTWVSRYQKSKTSLDLYEARGDGGFGMQWHQGPDR